MEIDKLMSKEQLIEDRKDKRVKLEGQQQSQMITHKDNKMDYLLTLLVTLLLLIEP